MAEADDHYQMTGFDAVGGPQGPAEASYVLDTHLNSVFGPTFAEVLEYETKTELGTSLYEALRDNPAGAVGVLRRIFRRGEAVGVILRNLTAKLAEPKTGHDMELLSLLEQAMPHVRRAAD